MSHMYEKAFPILGEIRWAKSLIEVDKKKIEEYMIYVKGPEPVICKD